MHHQNSTSINMRIVDSLADQENINLNVGVTG